MNIIVSKGRLEINKAKQRNPANSPGNYSIQKLDFTARANLCFFSPLTTLGRTHTKRPAMTGRSTQLFFVNREIVFLFR